MGTGRHKLAIAGAVAGYALAYIVSASTVWSGDYAFLVDRMFSPASFDSSSFVRAGAYTLTFIIVGLLLSINEIKKRASDKTIIAILSVLASLAVTGGVASVSQRGVHFLGLVLLGVGMSLLFLTWETVFSTIPAKVNLAVIGLAALCSGCVYLPVFPQSGITSPLAVSIVSWLSSALALILVLAPKKARGRVEEGQLTEKGRKLPEARGRTGLRGALSCLWKPMLCVAALGFSSELIRASAFDDSTLLFIVNAFSTLGIVLSGVVLLIIFAFTKGNVEFLSIFKFAFPIIVSGFVLMPFLGTIYRGLFVAMSFIAFSTFISLLMVTCVELARKYRCSSAGLFGLAAGIIYLFADIGSFTGYQTNNVEHFGLVQVFMIALLSTYVLVVAFLAVYHRSKGARAEESMTDQGRSLSVQAPSDSFNLRCDQLARQFDLTLREAQVMALYSRGWNTPSISAQLGVSDNTVRTHERNLFRKLGIHSKQELVRLVMPE